MVAQVVGQCSSNGSQALLLAFLVIKSFPKAFGLILNRHLAKNPSFQQHPLCIDCQKKSPKYKSAFLCLKKYKQNSILNYF
jgi:hypothetical protein